MCPLSKPKDENISLSVVTSNKEGKERGRRIVNSVVVIGNNITDITVKKYDN